LLEFTQKENALKQALEQEKQRQSELIQQQNELEQHLEQERQARIDAEQVLIESRQRENELKQSLDEEKYTIIKNEEPAQVQNEFIAKEEVISNNDELKNNSQHAEFNNRQKSRHYLGFIVSTLFVGIILIILVALWQIMNYEPKMSVKTSINEPPANIITTKPPVINPHKKICVHFKTKSWISIADKSGQSLYEGIYNVGDILIPKGLPPFYIKVGKISGVYVGSDCSKINRVINYPKQIGSKNVFIIGDE
jgi:hypothetical protein